ncbi:YeaC family protein [Photobacterium damselae]
MNMDSLLDTMTPTIYEQLSRAVETGKWANGVQLTDEQRSNAMQVMMIYQSRFNQEAQHMTVAQGGELNIKTKTDFQQEMKELARSNEIFRTKLK